jgi:hypothetical protein
MGEYAYLRDLVTDQFFRIFNVDQMRDHYRDDFNSASDFYYVLVGPAELFAFSYKQGRLYAADYVPESLIRFWADKAGLTPPATGGADAPTIGPDGPSSSPRGYSEFVLPNADRVFHLFKNAAKIETFAVHFLPLVHVDASGTTDVLAELNRKIRDKCSTMYVKIGNLYDMANVPGSRVASFYHNKPYLTLCLYHDADCVSSVQLQFSVPIYPDQTTAVDDWIYEFDTRAPAPGDADATDAPTRRVAGQSFEINSETMAAYQGNRYNKLLRAVTLLLAPSIQINGRRLDTLISRPVNPISAYTLISAYRFTFGHPDDATQLARFEHDRRQNVASFDLRDPVVKAFFDHLVNPRERHWVGPDGKKRFKNVLKLVIALTPENLHIANGEITEALTGAKSITCASDS